MTDGTNLAIMTYNLQLKEKAKIGAYMTEQQHEEELLSELLDLPEHADPGDNATTGQPILTRREEQALLRAANQVGTPTLARTKVRSTKMTCRVRSLAILRA
jgi:hypothetical protein